MGLSISKRLVELMGGKISVKSKSDKGAVFSFTIPFPIGAANNTDVKITNIDNASLKILKQAKILLVEDNIFNQTVAIDTLDNLIPGIQIALAENGQIALDMIQKNSYDIIILDIQMPVMDGYETAKHIRNDFESPKNNLPILAMTANVFKEDIEKCYQSGMNDYIAKPIDQQLLLSKIIGLLKKSDAQLLIKKRSNSN